MERDGRASGATTPLDMQIYGLDPQILADLPFSAVAQIVDETSAELGVPREQVVDVLRVAVRAEVWEEDER